MNIGWHRVAYIAGSLVGAGLLVLEQELLAGQVPIPREFAWVVPIGIAVIGAAFMFLPPVHQNPPSVPITPTPPPMH